jgi:acyl phosphate:glycerol-3-phosphate acyltransferase
MLELNIAGMAVATGYLLGSIPFGLILTHLAGTGDLRQTGSGNIGATNVLRTGSKWLALLTLLLDTFKGAAAVLVVGSLWGNEAGLVAGLGAFLGHCFPVWLKFRGGKGIATFIGVLAATDWKVAIIFVAIWLTIAIATRYSSLSALLATAAMPVIFWLYHPPLTALIFLLMAAIAWTRHYQNIVRLLSGTESKIGVKGSK